MPISISGDGSIGSLSATEIGYLDGVTSAVQTQINGKLTTPGYGSSWTPILTASITNPTLGTGSTATGTYMQIGKFVIASFTISFGTSGANAGNGDYYISIPVPGITYAWKLSGSISLGDNSTNILRIAAPLYFINGSTISLRIDSTVSGGYTVTHAVPWAWAASDAIYGTLMYEAA